MSAIISERLIRSVVDVIISIQSIAVPGCIYTRSDPLESEAGELQITVLNYSQNDWMVGCTDGLDIEHSQLIMIAFNSYIADVRSSVGTEQMYQLGWTHQLLFNFEIVVFRIEVMIQVTYHRRPSVICNSRQVVRLV